MKMSFKEQIFQLHLPLNDRIAKAKRFCGRPSIFFNDVFKFNPQILGLHLKSSDVMPLPEKIGNN